MAGDGVVLLAARTTRSQSYAQALAHAGLSLSHVVLFGQPRPPAAAENHSPLEGALADLFLPDFSVSLEETCRVAGWPCTSLAAGNINDPEIHRCVTALDASLAVYSGYGGQIVKKTLLEAGPPLLHMHSGWLPRYRGSTTLYYSLLDRGDCAVSALLLDAQIDTGPVVHRQRYAAPPPSMEVDRLYDGAIRADTLSRVLRHLAEHGALPAPIAQDTDGGLSYYVIHPVLKHLAMLGLGRDEP